MGKARTANLDDVPAIVQLILDSIQKDRLWLKFSPSKSLQDETYITEIESLLEEHLDPSMKDWIIEVVDQGGKIVSVAIWDVNGAQGSNTTKREHKTYIRDSRLISYIKILHNAEEKFASRYPQSMCLQLLATHPAHRGKGYAKSLVNSHISRVKQTGGVFTTIGGAAGYIFFSGLGFRDLGLVEAPASMAAETETIKALSLELNKLDRGKSLVDSVVGYVFK